MYLYSLFIHLFIINIVGTYFDYEMIIIYVNYYVKTAELEDRV